MNEVTPSTSTWRSPPWETPWSRHPFGPSTAPEDWGRVGGRAIDPGDELGLEKLSFRLGKREREGSGRLKRLRAMGKR
jgi:hypothetical protein